MQDSNQYGEPICDDCGMTQPKGTKMHEIGMDDEPDVWLCPYCHEALREEIKSIAAF